MKMSLQRKAVSFFMLVTVLAGIAGCHSTRCSMLSADMLARRYAEIDRQYFRTITEISERLEPGRKEMLEHCSKETEFLSVPCSYLIRFVLVKAPDLVLTETESDGSTLISIDNRAETEFDLKKAPGYQEAEQKLENLLHEVDASGELSICREIWKTAHHTDEGRLAVKTRQEMLGQLAKDVEEFKRTSKLSAKPR